MGLLWRIRSLKSKGRRRRAQAKASLESPAAVGDSVAPLLLPTDHEQVATIWLAHSVASRIGQISEQYSMVETKEHADNSSISGRWSNRIAYHDKPDRDRTPSDYDEAIKYHSNFVGSSRLKKGRAISLRFRCSWRHGDSALAGFEAVCLIDFRQTTIALVWSERCEADHKPRDWLRGCISEGRERAKACG